MTADNPPREGFDRFTVDCRAALALAQEAAERLNHLYIDAEHLLLGLLRVPNCNAVKALIDLGADLQKVRETAEFVIAHGDPQGVGLTGRAQRILQLSVDEARRLNASSIDTGHLLLALIRESKENGTGVLESMVLDEARAQVQRLLSTKNS